MKMKSSLKMDGILEVRTRPAPKGILADLMRALLFIKAIARLYYMGGWQHILTKHNQITNIGYTAVANHLTGEGTYLSTTFRYFAWSNGTTNPALTDTAATFYADGSAWDTKAVTNFDAFVVATKTQTWQCFVSSSENTVASVTKFALMNADPGTIMFESVEFAAIAKDSTKEFYFRYSLVQS